ncbi:MAG TPA: hypothetical protein VFJ29_06555, partial [Candidatus Kapabacteria bacterium]|nr:hypothetical protein [Candidatus Kapabacteria bacterium]
MELVIPVMVDSIGPDDSIGGFQLKIVVDSTRLQFLDINTDGTLSSSCTIWSHGHKNDTASIIATESNLSASMIGSGPLIYLIYEVVNDTAGVVPLQIDTVYTRLGKVTGDGSVNLNFNPGSVTFIPTMELGIESENVTITTDSVITVPV